MFLLICIKCESQDLVYFNGERVEKIEEGNWYSVNNQLELKEIKPTIKHVVDEENDFEGRVINVNHESIIIFKTERKDIVNKFNQLPLSSRLLVDEVRIEINEEYYLKWKHVPNPYGNNGYLSIGNIVKGIESRDFTNCVIDVEVNNYFGCGSGIFRVELIGDIINDDKPEIIISADKEGGVLKLLIGYKEGKYKVLRWTEFE